VELNAVRIAGEMQASAPVALPTRPSLPAEPAFDTVNISFSYDKAIRQIVATLYRADTGEIVREIPPEKIRRFVAGMLEMISAHFEALG